MPRRTVSRLYRDIVTCLLAYRCTLLREQKAPPGWLPEALARLDGWAGVRRGR